MAVRNQLDYKILLGILPPTWVTEKFEPELRDASTTIFAGAAATAGDNNFPNTRSML